jgi:hypothetical protein
MSVLYHADDGFVKSCGCLKRFNRGNLGANSGNFRQIPGAGEYNQNSATRLALIVMSMPR